MATNIKKVIVLTGGETGGHIYPLIAVAEGLKKVYYDNAYELELHYVGAPGTYEAELAAAGIKVHKIMSGKLRRYFSPANFVDIPKIFVGLIQSFIKIFSIMPDVVFSKGGTGALQVVIAAKFYAIPIVIHESDAYPGLTNLLSARLAKKIIVSFENAARYFLPPKTILIGNPVRPSILKQKLEPGAAREALGFDPGSPLLLILGGSQGSQRINEFMIAILPKLIPEMQILHQTGAANYQIIQKLAQATLVDVSVSAELKNRYKAVSYLQGKENAYALSGADLVVGRAGSGTIFEVAAFGVPSILIPLPEAAGDHQRENAYAYSESGASMVIEEANLAPQILISRITHILTDKGTLSGMRAAAEKFSRPNAAADIAEVIFRIS